MSGHRRSEIYERLFCLSSQSYSFSHVREGKKRLSQTQQPTFHPSDPPHTLIQELLNPINLLNICLWVLTLLKLYSTCLPSHNKYGLIYKGMLGLSRLRQLYSVEVAHAESARKNTFFQREQFICGPLEGWGKGCWEGQSYCPPTDPGTYSWKLNKRKRIHFGVWDPPPGLLAN